jgi:hypothetical protein
MPPEYSGDVISGMCNEGKHGRCSGWMIVPSYRKAGPPDISIKCRCSHCDHPEVAHDRHLTDPPERSPAPWNS